MSFLFRSDCPRPASACNPPSKQLVRCEDIPAYNAPPSGQLPPALTTPLESHSSCDLKDVVQRLQPNAFMDATQGWKPINGQNDEVPVYVAIPGFGGAMAAKQYRSKAGMMHYAVRIVDPYDRNRLLNQWRYWDVPQWVVCPNGQAVEVVLKMPYVVYAYSKKYKRFLLIGPGNLKKYVEAADLKKMKDVEVAAAFTALENKYPQLKQLGYHLESETGARGLFQEGITDSDVDKLDFEGENQQSPDETVDEIFFDNQDVSMEKKLSDYRSKSGKATEDALNQEEVYTDVDPELSKIMATIGAKFDSYDDETYMAERKRFQNNLDSMVDEDCVWFEDVDHQGNKYDYAVPENIAHNMTWEPAENPKGQWTKRYLHPKILSRITIQGDLDPSTERDLKALNQFNSSINRKNNSAFSSSNHHAAPTKKYVSKDSYKGSSFHSGSHMFASDYANDYDNAFFSRKY